MTGDNNHPKDSSNRQDAQRASIPPTGGAERRSYERINVASWAVDYQSGETFLYAYITNISAMGIFIQTQQPLPIGTQMVLRFTPPNEEPIELTGEVAWINPFREGGENLNPGMGIRFVELDGDTRERLVDLVRTIAYLPDDVDQSKR